jgi:hypothetical protein
VALLALVAVFGLAACDTKEPGAENQGGGQAQGKGKGKGKGQGQEAGQSLAVSRIVLEDMHAGAWMAMENWGFMFYKDEDGDGNLDPDGFIPKAVPACVDPAKQWGNCDKDDYENWLTYRHGVLFQMGPAVSFAEDGTRDEHNFFGGIYIAHDGGEEWLLPDLRESKKFDWLDVREAGSKCVIDPWGAYMMLVEPALVDNECPDPKTLDNKTTPTYRCARNRSVHTDVESHYIVTYWAGADFYRMHSGETSEKTIPLPDGTEWGTTHGATSHVSFTFKLKEEVVVDRWLLGCHEETYTGVTEIRILYHDPPAFHNGFPHLPVNGGRGG